MDDPDQMTLDIGRLEPALPNRGRHVLMPNMAYACGGSILTKDGGFTFPDRWSEVTCPDCLSFGEDTVRTEARRQQGLDS